MTIRLRALRKSLAFLGGLALLFAGSSTLAQWADQRYQYRIPLTVSNTTTHAFASGDLVTATVPLSALAGAMRTDRADLAVFHNTTPLPAKSLVMGGSVKVIFPLQSALAANTSVYGITENLNAGKTNYASLPTGTKLTFDNADDADVAVTLPFSFPFKTGTTNKLNVAIDGYVVPGGDPAGSYLRYDIDNLTNALGANFIAPWLSDFAISDAATMGVYADLTNPAQATFRWEVQASASGPIVAKFALILKPNGDIRFIYGTPCGQDTGITYSPPKYGVGVGDAAVSPVTEVGFVDFSGHNDITYSQTFPTPVTLSGYYLYFGGPSIATPPAVPPGVQSWDFEDGQLHGWISQQDPTGTGSGTSDVRIVSSSLWGKELLLSSTTVSLTDHPFMFAGGMTPVGPNTVYLQARVANAGGDAIGVWSRSRWEDAVDDQGIAYKTPVMDSVGIGCEFYGGANNTPRTISAGGAGTNGRVYAVMNTINNGIRDPFVADTSALMVVATPDIDDGLGGKSSWAMGKLWSSAPNSPTPAEDPSPGQFEFQGDSSTLPSPPAEPLGTGVLSIMAYGSVYLKWATVVPGGWSEQITTPAGATETAPTPGTGKAVIQGVVYDASIGISAPLAGVTVTIKDPANTTLGTAVTDASGKYRLVVAAGPSAVVDTITATAVGRYGSATQSVVENNTYTVNVPVTFDGRATGLITDSATGGGVPGASVQLLQPGTTTVVASTLTAADGTYLVDFLHGTYDLKVTISGYADVTKPSVVFPAGVAVVNNFSLNSVELAFNGGFEIETDNTDAAGIAGTKRPLGYITRTYTSKSTASNDIDPTAGDDSVIFYYVKNGTAGGSTHGGTHSVAFRRTDNSIESWEGGAGYLYPVQPGFAYKVGVWVKHTAGFDARLRVRFPATNDPFSSLDSLGYYFYDNTSNTSWHKLDLLLAPPKTPKYMSVRIYGNGPADSSAVNPAIAYFDDISVIQVATRKLTGRVLDTSGNPVAGVRVGAAIGRNGLADPDAAGTTDASGNFTLELLQRGVFNVQAWLPGYMATSQVVVDTTNTDGAIPPITLVWTGKPAYSLAALKPATGVNALGDNLQIPFNAVNGRDFSWGSSVENRWRTPDVVDPATEMPITLTVDCGKAITTSQIAIQWTMDRASNYDILSSNDGTNWSVVYASGANGQKDWSAGSGEDDEHSDVITLTNPVTARYFRVVLKAFSDYFTRFTIKEFRLDVPAGVVTGKVITPSGAPVAGAFVGIHPDGGNTYATTAADGTYSIILPTTEATAIRAHKMASGTEVYPLSDPISVTASVAGTVSVEPIVLNNPVPNLMPAGTTVYSSATVGADEDTNPVTNAVDRNLGTRWGFSLGTAWTNTDNVTLNIDMGANVTFNTMVVMWERAYAPFYKIATSTDGTTFTTLIDTRQGTGGYPHDFAGSKFVEAYKVAPRTARYMTIESYACEIPNNSIWEVQLANAPANPPAPASAATALRIWAGLKQPTSAEVSTNDAVVNGKIDLNDAVSLAKAGKL